MSVVRRNGAERLACGLLLTAGWSAFCYAVEGQSRFSADQIAGTSDGGVALTLNIYQLWTSDFGALKCRSSFGRGSNRAGAPEPRHLMFAV
jgi:hypothetical protein